MNYYTRKKFTSAQKRNIITFVIYLFQTLGTQFIESIPSLRSNSTFYGYVFCVRCTGMLSVSVVRVCFLCPLYGYAFCVRCTGMFSVSVVRVCFLCPLYGYVFCVRFTGMFSVSVLRVCFLCPLYGYVFLCPTRVKARNAYRASTHM